MRLLLVEDDTAIAESLRDGLALYRYDVEWVGSGAAALTAVAGDPGIEFVLLDLGLPDMDGLDVCRKLRETSQLPIIIITARADEVDTVVGLEVGADDYISKPFGVRELVARVRAVLRRSNLLPGDEAPDGGQDLGPLRVDRRSRRVFADGSEVALAPKEFDLLSLLAEQPGAVLTREHLIEAVWDEHWFGSTRTLDVHVAALRRKLGDAAPITTVRGVGFRLEQHG